MMSPEPARTEPYEYAFPSGDMDGDVSGLTKKEFFAACAMIGLIARSGLRPDEGFPYPEEVARDAIDHACEMMGALNRDAKELSKP